jgi:hypothetical protein
VTTAFLFCVLPAATYVVWEGNTEQGARPHRLRTAPVDRQPLSQYCLRTVSGRRRRRRRQHLPHPRIGLFAIELALVRLHQRAHDLQDTRYKYKLKYKWYRSSGHAGMDVSERAKQVQLAQYHTQVQR